MSDVTVTEDGSTVTINVSEPVVNVGEPAIVSASAVPVTPTGGIAATNVQAALAELDAEKQPLDAELSALAALTSAADTVPYFTGLGTAALASLTAYGRNLIAAADAASALTVLGIPLLATAGITGALTLSKQGITARTAMFPDAMITVAGQNIDNAFSVAQTFAGSAPGTPTAGQVLVGGGQIKTAGVVSCQGLQNTVGDLTSRADEDAQTILGRIRCGFFTGLGDNASFAHYDFATSSSYALRQDAAGATSLNSATGQNATIRVNNTTVLTASATALTAAQPITIDKIYTDTSGTPGSLASTARANPGSASTAQIYGIFFSAQSTAGNAQNLSGSTYALCGAQGFAYHFGSGTANKVFGAYFGAQQRSGAGAVAQLSALTLQVDNLDASTAVTGGYGINILAPANSGGNFTSWRAISIAATAVGTTNCIGIDIGAMTGTGAYAIRTSTGPVLFGDQVTVPNGTASAPGLRLTSEASGPYRISATKLGFAVGGIGALGLEKPGSGYGGGFQLLTQADADYTYIYSDRTNAEMRIAPGANSLDGANIRLFGNGHATPNQGSLRHSTTDKLTWNATGIGFFAAAPVAKPTVTGSRGGNAALASLLTALANFGLLTDSSS